METKTETNQSPPEASQRTRPRTDDYTRASDRRIFAGVAEGLARRTGIWVGWIRTAFILLALAGGFGVAVYVVLWLLVRADDEPDTIAQRFFARTTGAGAWIGAALIFVALLIILGNVPFLSAGAVWAVGLLAVGFLLYSGDLPRLIDSAARPKEEVQQVTKTTDYSPTAPPVDDVGGHGHTVPTPPSPPVPLVPTPPILPAPRPPKDRSYLGRVTIGVMVIALGVLAMLDVATTLVDPAPRHYIALAITVLGVGLLVGTVIGRARWLILVGVLTIPVMVGSPIFEFDFTEITNGTEFIVPDSPESVPPVLSYGIGDVVIDLTDMEWNNSEVDLDAELDIGHMDILIPHDVAVVGVAQSSIGLVRFGGRESAGLDPTLRFNTEGNEGVLNLSALVRIGGLEIHRIVFDN